MEIERKFLISEIPENLPVYDTYSIIQGYISTEPEVRIRSLSQSYRSPIIEDTKKYFPNGGVVTNNTITIKSLGNMVREEIEITISDVEFQRLMLFINKPMISKKVTVVLLQDNTRVECSVIDWNTPLFWMSAEIEFPSIEAAKAFDPPSWLKVEVTEDADYKMRNYWKRKHALTL